MNVTNYQYKGTQISFMSGDNVMLNATQMAKPFGKRPCEWKKIGKEAGLKSKECSSGKEVLRHLKPEVACGMSFVDNAVKMGGDIDKAIKLSKEHAVHLFKGMLEMGITPGELNQ